VAAPRAVQNTPESWDRMAALPTPWEAASWSEEGQRRRFETVARLLGERMRPGESVLDYGCGTGAFADWKIGLGLRHWRYGYDWSPQMRARARAEHPELVVLEELPDRMFDHVVCIGPFNLSDSWSFADTRECLAGLWAKTARTLIVSLYRGELSPDVLSYDSRQLCAIVDRLGYPRFRVHDGHYATDVILDLSREPVDGSAPSRTTP
jgi:SAM-dependent methyltransferase